MVTEPLGRIQWETARVEGGSVLVQTRHWLDGDGGANPSGPGAIRITVTGGLTLANEP